MALVKCVECGSDVSERAPSCVRCGNPVGRPEATRAPAPAGAGPSRLLCAFLAFFCPFGVHRFVLGYPEIGVAQALLPFVTCGLSCWWDWVDGVRILTGSLRARDGRELS